MNLQIITRINNYRLLPNSEFEKIKTFLQVGILHSELDLIEGETLDEKVETIYEYLNNIVKKPKKPEVKQSINIVIADDASSLDYVAYLKQKYEVTVHKIADVKNPKDIDLVLFTGGEDVNPANYGESVGKHTGINQKRDQKEMDTFYRFKGNSFLLGICRGSQLLTVLNNGRLIQHVEGHCRDHSILVRGGLRYNITSSHHQMLYPFNLNEKDYELIAYSEYFQSKTYLNGNNEEIELSKDFLEPEIVYYKNTDSLCIQGHPEWNHCEKRTSNFCLNLIDKYLQEFKKSKEGVVLNNHHTSSHIQGSWDDSSYNDENEEPYDEEGSWEPVEEENIILH